MGWIGRIFGSQRTAKPAETKAAAPKPKNPRAARKAGLAHPPKLADARSLLRVASEISSGAELAQRTLARLAELDRNVVSAAVSGPGIQAAKHSHRRPRIDAADGETFAQAQKYYNEILMPLLSGGFMPLVGEATIELSYTDRRLCFEPPLETIRDLRQGCLEEAHRLSDPAPVMEIEALRAAVAALLLAIAGLHEYRLDWLDRITPEAAEDGTWRPIWDAFVAGGQAAVDALDSRFLRVVGASSILTSALTAITDSPPRARASQPTKKRPVLRETKPPKVRAIAPTVVFSPWLARVLYEALSDVVNDEQLEELATVLRDHLTWVARTQRAAGDVDLETDEPRAIVYFLIALLEREVRRSSNLDVTLALEDEIKRLRDLVPRRATPSWQVTRLARFP